jgi:regulator of cell morphogenesis and NO signaling
MTTLTADMTVGEIAAQLPASTRVFENHHIDFCCGGKRPLRDACQTRGLDPAAVLEEVEQAAGPRTTSSIDWQSASLASLADYIVETHHAYLKTNMPRMEALLQKVLAAHGERHGGFLLPLAQTLHTLREELDAHLMKEERVLFPLIRSLESAGQGAAAAPPSHCGSVQNPIRVMVAEHDSAGDALVRIRELTGGFNPPADACNTFRALYYELSQLESDLHRHIHLENNILFPRAVELEN